MEIRGQNTRIRERIGIIEAGTGTIIGEVNLYSTEEMYPRTWRACRDKHHVEGLMPYPKTYGWKFSQAEEYQKPKNYKHPKGAQRWVTIG